MKRRGIILIILAIFLVSCTQSSTTQINSNENNIIIKDFGFNAQSITIKVGDVVTWVNEDPMQHTVTSDSGSELNSDSLNKGEIYSHTFNQKGTFSYQCNIHPSMKGKIIVE
jgi:amicyanin